MSLLGELTYALIQPSSRAVGTIVPDVVVREVHRDELIITQIGRASCRERVCLGV